MNDSTFTSIKEQILKAFPLDAWEENKEQFRAVLLAAAERVQKQTVQIVSDATPVMLNTEDTSTAVTLSKLYYIQVTAFISGVTSIVSQVLAAIDKKHPVELGFMLNTLANTNLKKAKELKQDIDHDIVASATVFSESRDLALLDKIGKHSLTIGEGFAADECYYLLRECANHKDVVLPSAQEFMNPNAIIANIRENTLPQQGQIILTMDMIAKG